MNISLVAFVVWTCVVSVLLLLIMDREVGIPWRNFTQIGDTSIGRHSFDWMGAIALTGAVVICCVLD